MQHSALKPDQYIPSYPLYIHMVHTLDKYPVNPVLLSAPLLPESLPMFPADILPHSVFCNCRLCNPACQKSLQLHRFFISHSVSSAKVFQKTGQSVYHHLLYAFSVLSDDSYENFVLPSYSSVAP